MMASYCYLQVDFGRYLCSSTSRPGPSRRTWGATRQAGLGRGLGVALSRYDISTARKGMGAFPQVVPMAMIGPGGGPRELFRGAGAGTAGQKVSPPAVPARFCRVFARVPASAERLPKHRKGLTFLRSKPSSACPVQLSQGIVEICASQH